MFIYQGISTAVTTTNSPYHHHVRQRAVSHSCRPRQHWIVERVFRYCQHREHRVVHSRERKCHQPNHASDAVVVEIYCSPHRSMPTTNHTWRLIQRQPWKASNGIRRVGSQFPIHLSPRITRCFRRNINTRTFHIRSRIHRDLEAARVLSVQARNPSPGQ